MGLMGNQKFKLSNMIQNAWFYKLKDMNNTTNNNKPSKSQSIKLKNDHFSSPPLQPLPSQASTTIKTTNEPPQYQPRKSYHITRELTNNKPSQELDFPPFSPPRRSKSSSKSRKSSRRTNSMSSCSCKSTTTFQSYRSKSNSPSSPPIFEDTLLKTEHKIEDIKTVENFDVVIDFKMEQSLKDSNSYHFKLPPIITKQETKPRNLSKDEKIIAPTIKEHKLNSSPKRYHEKGMRLKMNSPRIMGRKHGQNGISSRKSISSKKRRSISESFAVVKSSLDPQKDFKESMMEMIVQNNLRGSKDLEDLLACYLSLNLDEYHEIIIDVFKQIWFDLRIN